MRSCCTLHKIERLWVGCTLACRFVSLWFALMALIKCLFAFSMWMNFEWREHKMCLMLYQMLSFSCEYHQEITSFAASFIPVYACACSSALLLSVTFSEPTIELMYNILIWGVFCMISLWNFNGKCCKSDLMRSQSPQPWACDWGMPYLMYT